MLLREKKESNLFLNSNEMKNLKYGIGAGINQKKRVEKSVSYKTNVLEIDGLIGGGIPSGSMIEIHGEEAAGKTLISLEYIKDAQKKGFKTAIFDYDMNLNLKFAQKIGVDLSSLEVISVPVAEDSLELLVEMIKSNLYGVIVIDSLPAMLPKREVGLKYEDIDIKTQAKIINKFLFKIKPILIKTNTILIFTNQTRMSMNTKGAAYRTVGGRTFRSFMDLRINLQKDSDILINNAIIGIKIEVVIIQNKIYNKIMMSFVDIIFDFGIVRYS